MRLVCPNCAAQYEVEDHVIPENGRDVQCSNCGHTWYQRSPNRPISKPRPDPSPEPVQEEPLEEADTSEEAAPAEQPVARQQRPLDGGITDILREEAARETAERQSERNAGGLETQPDLGLDSRTDETPPNIRERMARLRELDEELDSTALAAAPAPASRKEMLPDIEEINSTLSPSDEAEISDEDIAAMEETRRSGFRRGFILVVVIFAAMALVYVFAPNIVELNPQSEPAVNAYVEWVNGLRTRLDGLLGGAADSLSGILDGLNNG